MTVMIELRFDGRKHAKSIPSSSDLWASIGPSMASPIANIEGTAV